MRDLESVVRRLRNARPFRTFVIELSSGSRIVVRHPEAVLMAGGTGVMVDRRGRISIFEAPDVVRVRWRSAGKTTTSR